MQQMQEGIEKPRPKVLFEVGEMVRVEEGPFTDFQWFGRRCQLRKEPLARIGDHFGRATPVELEFGQVEKT